MKRALFFLILLSLYIVAYSETYVVCVGIGNYADSRVQDLTKTETDAKSMAEFYKKGTENVIIITGKYATKSKILASLKSQFKRAKKGDKIIFYFSGHGYPGGFCPYDMHSLETGLTYSEVVKIMDSSKASQKMIFADACNSGSIRADESNKVPEVGNILFFLSSRGKESSIESPFASNVFFTKNLLRGLKGGADYCQDREITARELFNFVSTKTKEDTGDRQHPVMWCNFPDDMIIVKYKKK